MLPKSHAANDIATEKPSQTRPAPLGRLGNLEVRLATNPDEIGQVIAVRDAVFSGMNTINEDRFDVYCDHLMVIDNQLANVGKTGQVVATYRLLKQERTADTEGFYSESEFALSPVLRKHSNLRFLEFGRSCVLPDYRSKRTLELLWHGSWAYVRQHKMDVMFGCASFPGTDLAVHREALSFLFQHCVPDADWQVQAVEGCAQHLRLIAKEEINTRRAIRSLPPLIKGYLRLGAMFSTQAVVDAEFETVDILVLLPVSKLNPRYVKHYGANAERHAVI